MTIEENAPSVSELLLHLSMKFGVILEKKLTKEKLSSLFLFLNNIFWLFNIHKKYFIRHTRKSWFCEEILHFEAFLLHIIY